MDKKRKQRSDEELVAISKDLLYEINMLLGSAHSLRVFCTSAEKNPISLTICNALIESFTVHARNLLNFLYSTNPQSDDVIAQDFFDDESIWVKQRPVKSQLLTTIHKRVAKEVAHLTYSRSDVTPQTKRWQYDNIANEIRAVLNGFIQLVPRRKLSNTFPTFIAQAVSANGRSSN